VNCVRRTVQPFNSTLGGVLADCQVHAVVISMTSHCLSTCLLSVLKIYDFHLCHSRVAEVTASNNIAVFVTPYLWVRIVTWC